ncbi:hypothetical protein CKY20_00955 [Capnocytophaga canis]|uniref:Outer membrane protein beta-barrel domain-containing protein n=1 Tax=Capnocytophaga canis TaxID=1848903 RepID=A0A3A1YL05_9FLAO|nr:hypothetical protein [Capnocytophaga canis]RIY38146.1 hypothetical protein CKY20_00955 [Capnocytophaga canis]
MKKIILVIFLLSSVGIGIVSAQDKKWYSQAELDMIIPRNDKVIYSYSGGQVSLNERVMWGVNYSYNYNLFKKFSVGGVSGLTILPQPSITAIKFGAVFRYTFIEDFKANMYAQIAGYLPLTNGVETDLGEARFGVNLPIARYDAFQVNLSLFVIYSRFDLNKPLFINEIPDSVEYRGTGISLGIRF